MASAGSCALVRACQPIQQAVRAAWHRPAPARPQPPSLQPSRRALLAGAGALLLPPFLPPFLPPAHAASLRSLHSQAPAVLTFRNELDRAVKIYWVRGSGQRFTHVNYTGDREFYAQIPPSGWWTVDTFETHAWHVVDGASGEVVHEVISPKGETLVRIDPLQEPSRLQPDGGVDDGFAGFDGVGGHEAEYVSASIAEIGLDHLGGVALIAAEDYPLPVPVSVGINDAAQLFHAAGPEFRRPSTMALWVRSLQAAGATVDRVLLTRLVGTTVYARIILALPDGQLRSLDARPSDSLALAMQTGAPLFMGRQLAAASQQPGSLEEVAEWHQRRPPTPSRQATPPASAQASYDFTRKA